MTRKTKTNRRRWRDDEIAILRAHYPTTRTELMPAMLPGRTVKTIQEKASNSGIYKTREFLAELGRETMARAGHPAHRSRFVKGHKSWNTGLAWTAGGRSPEHRFKPGNLSGNAALLKKPVGSERLSRDGYIERKINEDRPFHRRWRAVHILLWEAEYGPLPKGHALAFKNGNKADIRLDNLELITRGDLLRRNSVHNYGPEISYLCRLKGAVTRQINRRTTA